MAKAALHSMYKGKQKISAHILPYYCSDLFDLKIHLLFTTSGINTTAPITRDKKEETGAVFRHLWVDGVTDVEIN
jgi:hypothetical protein